MIILITGTPGTGKTTVARMLAERLGFEVKGIEDLAVGGAVVGYDEAAGSKIIDMEKVARDFKASGDIIVEGHLAHRLPTADYVIVLRTNPEALRKRLRFTGRKLEENLEAEALDVCLVESVEEHGIGKVYEIDTTRRGPSEVVDAIVQILRGQGNEFKPGEIDWTEEFFSKA